MNPVKKCLDVVRSNFYPKIAVFMHGFYFPIASSQVFFSVFFFWCVQHHKCTRKQGTSRMEVSDNVTVVILYLLLQSVFQIQWQLNAERCLEGDGLKTTYAATSLTRHSIALEKG